MIIGTGIDIVELRRIEQIVKKQPRFIERILTEMERADYAALHERRKIEWLAGRFAAKEAFVKAVGTGISAQFRWHDVEIRNEASGKPYIAVLKPFYGRIHLSISHSMDYAIASVIIESSSS